ncbi:MAG: hypothetical protein NZ959_08885 [Armatimonadetes bacterium]|nr:hypothetical protein [Armatimonadota bacterium]MDW8121462.1 hypothetical protein [Armatimonadota bacterium]
MLRIRWVITLTLLFTSFCLFFCQAASRPRSGPIPIRFTAQTTLLFVLREMSQRTNARLILDPETRKFAEFCPFPPHLHGKAFSFPNVGDALAFLTGKGWEGSPLPIQFRTVVGPSYQLSRCPTPVRVAGKTFWTCNNPAITASWSKKPADPPGGVIRIGMRTRSDGDLVQRNPIEIVGLTGVESVDYIRDRIKELTGIYFNFSPEWHQNVNYKLLPEYKGVTLPADPEIPLTLSKIRTTLAITLPRQMTLGQWLTVIAAGLNEHSKARQCFWKWSASDKDRPVYTIRCYAHME